MNYYRVSVKNLNDDFESTPLPRTALKHQFLTHFPSVEVPAGFLVQKPVLFLGATKDAVGIPALMQQQTVANCPNATPKVLDSGHWIQLEVADEVNTELENWITTVVLA